MTEPKRYQCRHIFTDGHRCGSPCLRHEDFCYYHHTTRRPVQDPRQRRANQPHFDLPMPEDRAAIQLSIGEILRRIARNDIDPRRAGLLLYGLQIASTNLPRNPKATSNTREDGTQPIEEITTDPEQGLLAPQSEFTQPERRLGIVGQLLKDLLRDQQLHEADTPQPTEILPTLQATAENPSLASVQIGVKPFRPQSAPTSSKLALLWTYRRGVSSLTAERVPFSQRGVAACDLIYGVGFYEQQAFSDFG